MPTLLNASGVSGQMPDTYFGRATDEEILVRERISEITENTGKVAREYHKSNTIEYDARYFGGGGFYFLPRTDKS